MLEKEQRVQALLLQNKYLCSESIVFVEIFIFLTDKSSFLQKMWCGSVEEAGADQDGTDGSNAACSMKEHKRENAICLPISHVQGTRILVTRRIKRIKYNSTILPQTNSLGDVLLFFQAFFPS